MRVIPPKLREEMAADPFYKKCCLTGRSNGKIEWHHNLIFAGRQVNEKWCILPLLKEVHDMVSKKEIKEIVDWIMLNRATEEELMKYSKARNLKWFRDYYNNQFGRWYEGKYVEIDEV